MAKHNLRTIIATLNAKAQEAGEDIWAYGVLVDGRVGGIAIVGKGSRGRGLVYIQAYLTKHLPHYHVDFWGKQCVVYADGNHQVQVIEPEVADGEGMDAHVVMLAA